MEYTLKQELLGSFCGCDTMVWVVRRNGMMTAALRNELEARALVKLLRTSDGPEVAVINREMNL